MNRKNRLLCLLIASIVLLPLSCKSMSFGSKKVIDINGMIYDFANKPVANCDIMLGTTYTGSTDINGRFMLPKIPVGTYSIQVRKAGYETYSDELEIKEQGQIVYIRIPSQNQLLTLVDEALTAMNFSAAEEYVQRAYQIDETNIEMLFYYATIRFRQRMYDQAIRYLETAQKLGSKDAYIDRFLAVLRDLKEAEHEQ